MQAFSRLRMQKSYCMLLARNIQSFQRNEKMSYLIIIGSMFVLNLISLICHMILGG